MQLSVLGVGRLGASHAGMLAKMSAITELRVFDADQARAKAVAEPLGARAVATVEAALAGIDAVVLVTPTATHASLIAHCVGLGLPVFCEKPIAIDLGETLRTVELVERSGARVQIGFQRRFDRGYQRARDEIRSGKIGSVYSFNMVSCDALPPPDAYVETSGGQFKDQLIHDFDITRWLLADEVAEVYATGSTRDFPQYERFADVATSAALLTMRGGTLGLLSAARRNEAGYDIHVEIHGAKDTIAIGIDPRTPWRSVEADAPPLAGPAYPTFFVRFADAYRAELEHFVGFASGRTPENLCGVRDALEALRIAEAAQRSRAERRPVALTEIAS